MRNLAAWEKETLDFFNIDDQLDDLTDSLSLSNPEIEDFQIALADCLYTMLHKIKKEGLPDWVVVK